MPRVPPAAGPVDEEELVATPGRPRRQNKGRSTNPQIETPRTSSSGALLCLLPLVHATHATAATTRHRRSLFLLFLLDHDTLGREHQARDRCGILQCRACDLG